MAAFRGKADVLCPPKKDVTPSTRTHRRLILIGAVDAATLQI